MTDHEAMDENHDPKNSQVAAQDSTDVGEKHEPETSRAAKEYPPLKIVLPAMGALWLAFFLVALVRTRLHSCIS